MIVGELAFLLMSPVQDDKWSEDRRFWIIMFLLTAIFRGVFAFFQKFLFTYVGENLTYNVRVKLYESLMYKSIAWFDSKDRAPGVLSNIMSEDITQLNGLTTETFSLIIESVSCLMLGIVIAFIYSWRMALVGFACSPIMMLGGYLMFKVQYKGTQSAASKDNAKVDFYRESNALLSDMILNYRTIISFGEKNVQSLMDKYNALLHIPSLDGIKNAHLMGFFFGYSQFARFGFIALTFYIGSIFILNYNENPKDTYIAIFVTLYTCLASGQSIS
jgi:ATP-binding cassette subfamily B (MDR/TAP) protein 1